MGDAEGDGMQAVQPSCSICCTGGTYTAFGTNSCTTGYTRAYAGRAGGIEGYASGQVYGSTLCINGNASAAFTWASGYNTRMFRFRAQSGSGANGMDVVDNACVVCVKP